MSPAPVAQSELRTQVQLMDILKRVQKLEDFQHVSTVEVAKVVHI